MSTGGPLRRYRVSSQHSDEGSGVLGIALATAVGFGAGVLAGLVVGDALGAVHPERVRQMFQSRRKTEPVDPEQVERDVVRVLKTTPATRRLDLSARALDGGLIELTGIAPDERTRQVAGDAAAGVAGADIVLNRILVQGRDVPPGHVGPPVQL